MVQHDQCHSHARPAPSRILAAAEPFRGQYDQSCVHLVVFDNNPEVAEAGCMAQVVARLKHDFGQGAVNAKAQQALTQCLQHTVTRKYSPGHEYYRSANMTLQWHALYRERMHSGMQHHAHAFSRQVAFPMQPTAQGNSTCS